MAHRTTGGTTVDSTQDPFGQWHWFESVLKKARKEDKAVGSKIHFIYYFSLVLSSLSVLVVEERAIKLTNYKSQHSR